MALFFVGDVKSKLMSKRDFFDPATEERLVGSLSNPRLGTQPSGLIESCEQCNPHRAEIPFDKILDRETGSDASAKDYILETPAKCPYRRTFLEETLIEPAH